MAITYMPPWPQNASNASHSDVIPDDMTDLDKPTEAHLDRIRYIKFYSLAVIIPLGIVFNSVASMIFLRKRMRNIPTAHYFLGLACADNIVLIGEFMLWTSSYDSQGSIIGLNLIHRNTMMCRLVYFLRYMGRLWSSWLVVAICLDRYITITLPNITLPCPCHDIFNKPLIILSGLVLISTALACPAFFAVGVADWDGNMRCLVLESFKDVYHKWRQAVMIVGELFLPSIIVAIFTALIIIRLARARNRIPGQQSITTRTEERVARRRCRDAQLTMSLLSVAVAFVILRLPYIIFYELNQAEKKQHLSEWMKFRIYVAYQITYLLAVTNYAINFFLYVISGVRFRLELLNLLTCATDQPGPASTVLTQHASIGRTSTREGKHNNMPNETYPLKEIKKHEKNGTNTGYEPVPIKNDLNEVEK